MKRFYFILFTVLISASFTVEAKSNKVKHVNEKHYSLAIEDKKVKLTKILDSVKERTGKKFLVHANSRAEVVAYGIDLDKISFSELLTIIDLNNMAAVEVEGIINIVPINRVKQYPIPSIQDGEKVEHGTLWVSKVINTGSNKVGQLVPILRALVRFNGHMASHEESNSLVLVAPYHSVVRIEHLIKELNAARSNRLSKKS